jgi:hypothetical protein
MPELERAPETTEKINSSEQSENHQQSESQSSESRQTLDTFGTSARGGDSSPLFSTSSSDAEFEQVAGELGGSDVGSEVGSESAAAPGKLIEFPVLDRDDIETALRLGHSAAVAAGWGEHWKLKDWQSTILIGPLDAFLQKIQGTAENYLGDFLTRFAGENKELCALLAVMVIVYAPNVRQTMKLKAQAGAAIAGTTTASAESSVTSASQA